MRSFVAVVLAALAVPLFAQTLAFRGEVPLSAAEYGRVANVTTDAQVASNGDGYVATWTDFRAGEPMAYAARFRADGTLLDPVGLRIAPSDFAGSVVWNGSAYLVLYGEGTTLYARTLSTDGTFGAPVAVLERESDTAVRLRMATNGSSILVVGAGVPAVLLDLDGNTRREVGLAGEYPFNGIEVAAAGSTYAVLAGEQFARLQVVEADGDLGGLFTLGQLGAGSGVAIGSDGTRFLALWSDDDLQAQPFTAAGPAGDVRTLTTSGFAGDPAVAWRGNEYFVTFAEKSTLALHGLRVAADGTPAAPAARTGAGQTIYPADLAARGTGGVAVWQSHRGGIDAGFYDAQSLAGTDPFRRVVTLSRSAQVQYDVHLARGASGTYAAWLEWTPNGTQLRLSRGTGGPAIALPVQSDRIVDVFVDGDIVWLLYGRTSTIYAQRFTTALEPIDLQPVFVAASDFSDPVRAAAAVGDGAVLIAFPVVDATATALEADLSAVLLRSEGTAIGVTKVALPHAPYDDHVPAVGFDGGEFFVAWAHAKAKRSEEYLEPAPFEQIVGVRIAADGTLRDLTPLVIADQGVTVQKLVASRNALAWQSWERSQSKVYTALFKAGSPIGDFGGDATARLATLTTHGDGYLLVRGSVAWNGEGNTATVETITLDARLAPTGVSSLPPFVIDTYWNPFDVDALGGTVPVVAYGRIANDGVYGHVSRLFAVQAGVGRRRSIGR